MGDVNIDHNVNDVEEELIPMEEDVEVWDDDMVAHEVTVDDGDEYIQVDALDEGYVDHGQGGHPGDMAPMDLLPMRDNGTPLFTLNLPDLLSRAVPVPGGGLMYLCFNKKASPQVAFDGYIYTLNGQLNMAAYNIWRCCVEGCSGAVRTSPNFSALKIRCDHSDGCMADDIQVRLRIAVYDLRLMAEFTDCDFPNLYEAFVDKLRQDQPDVVQVFPDYHAMHPDLLQHRSDLLFRKRFEMRKTLNQRRQQGLIIEKGQFKRTKAFPPSICVECNMEFPSGDLAPSQDLLIQHLTYQHERPLVIERYTFSEAALFEQWIRELAQHSRYRMRKVGLYDEHMYYLCNGDDRQQRCNHGKGVIISTQCSAFIRVHDWRYILRREVKPVVVDYCLDHSFHTGDSPLPDSYRQPLYDYYSPEVFMKELEARRHRTQRLLMSSGAGSLQRIKRVNQGPSSSQMHYADGRAISENEMYMMDPYAGEGEMDMTMQAQNQMEWGNEEEVYDQGQVGMQQRVTFNIKRDPPILRDSQIEGNRSASHVTVRNNFDDHATFQTVMQLELQCDNIKHRMQQCRRADVAKRYLTRLTSVLDDIMADPHCAPRLGNEPGPSAPSTSKYQLKRPAPGPETYGKKIMAPVKQVVTVKTLPSADGSSPVRQAMFLKRGENGEMIVVKKIIRKVRKAVEVSNADESVVQPLPSTAKPEEEFEPVGDNQTSASQAAGQPTEEDVSPGKRASEMPASFLETPTPAKRGRGRGRGRH